MRTEFTPDQAFILETIIKDNQDPTCCFYFKGEVRRRDMDDIFPLDQYPEFPFEALATPVEPSRSDGQLIYLAPVVTETKATA